MLLDSADLTKSIWLPCDPAKQTYAGASGDGMLNSQCINGLVARFGDKGED